MWRCPPLPLSPLYYVWKVVSTYALLGAAVALVLGSETLIAHFAAAVLVALFWQQCGWLSHDFLHHQVCVYMCVSLS